MNTIEPFGLGKQDSGKAASVVFSAQGELNQSKGDSSMVALKSPFTALVDQKRTISQSNSTELNSLAPDFKKLEGSEGAEARMEGRYHFLRQEILNQAFLQNSKSEDSVTQAFANEYILYPVPQGTQACEVGDMWSAESVSDRILNFAMSFQQIIGGGDQEFLEKIRTALLEAFARVKEEECNVPDDLAALYNDTFQLTMSKLDAKLHAARTKFQSVEESYSNSPASKPTTTSPELSV